MAGPESAGAIYYTVDADTGKLLDSSAAVDKVLDKNQKSFDKTDKAAASTQAQLTKTAGAAKELVRQVEAAQNPLSNFTRLIGGLVTLQGATALLQMAEAYGSMAERVKMAAGSQAEYEQVQQRLLATANGTYRALSEAQEVFIATSENLRDLGYSLDQALDIADSLSYSFVANATATDKANNALRAYDLALNKGKVEADGFITIIGAIPTIAGDIGRAIGKTAQEVREMGASGKLTAAQLNEGLRTSLDRNKTAADAMAVSVKDAFVAMKNNIAAYVGEANEASGTTATMAKAVMALGQNVDVVAKVLLALGAGALAKYVAGLIASTVASAQASIAARAQAAATLQQAQAHAAATAATATQTAAMVGLTTTSTAAAAASQAAAAAQLELAAAQRAAQVAGVGLLGILGGPAGIIALLAAAAVGIYAFGSNASSAVPKVDQLTDSIDKLTAAQLAQRKMQAASAVEKLTQDAIAANGAVKGLEKDFAALNKRFESGKGGITTEGLDNVKKALVDARAESDGATKSLQAMIDAEAKLSREQQSRTSRPTTAPGAPKARQDPEVKKRLDDMKDELALTKLTGEARSRLQAIQKLGANATAAEKEEAAGLAAQIFKIEEARKSGKKGLGDTEKQLKKDNTEADSYLKKLKEQDAQVSKMTVSERLKYDLLTGEVKLSGQQLEQATEIARRVDDRAQAEKDTETALNLQNAAMSAQLQLKAKMAQYDADLAAYGMGDKAAQEMQDRVQLEADAAQRMQQIDDERRSALLKADDNDRARVTKYYADLIATEQAYQQQSLAAYDSYVQSKRQKDTDWQAGAKSAMENWFEQTRNSYQQAKDFMTSALGSAGQTLTDFVTKGEADVGGLLKGLLADLVKLEMQALVTNIAMKVQGKQGPDAVGLLGQVLGFGSSVATDGAEAATSATVTAAKTAEVGAITAVITALGAFATALSSISATQGAKGFMSLLGFSSGGYTGPGGKYQAAGVVHAGEFVQRKEVVGQPGAKQFLSDFNRRGMQALNDWAGYSGGGYVPDSAANAVRQGIPSPAAVGGGSTTVDNQIMINFVESEDRIVSALGGRRGVQAVTMMMSRDPQKFRQVLGV